MCFQLLQICTLMSVMNSFKCHVKLYVNLQLGFSIYYICMCLFANVAFLVLCACFIRLVLIAGCWCFPVF